MDTFYNFAPIERNTDNDLDDIQFDDPAAAACEAASYMPRIIRTHYFGLSVEAGEALQ